MYACMHVYLPHFLCCFHVSRVFVDHVWLSASIYPIHSFSPTFSPSFSTNQVFFIDFYFEFLKLTKTNNSHALHSFLGNPVCCQSIG